MLAPKGDLSGLGQSFLFSWPWDGLESLLFVLFFFIGTKSSSLWANLFIFSFFFSKKRKKKIGTTVLSSPERSPFGAIVGPIPLFSFCIYCHKRARPFGPISLTTGHVLLVLIHTVQVLTLIFLFFFLLLWACPKGWTPEGGPFPFI